MTGHPAWTPKALFWAGWQLYTGFLLSPVVNSKRSGEDLRFSRGGPPPSGPLLKAPSPPAICIQDGLSAVAGFLVIIPHTLQPCLLRTGCQAAAWPAVAVTELDKAPASLTESPPQPGAPSGGKAASSPGPGRSLSGVGAGSCAWPQELLASANPSLGSASLVPAHCAHCLRCSETRRSRPVWFSPWPPAARPSALPVSAGGSGHE